MKGIVYAGVAYLPTHPAADLHGLVRAVIRTSSPMRLAETLRALDIPFHMLLFQQGIWRETRSIAEQQATERAYGELLVCPLWAAYLTAEHYQPARGRS